MAIDRIQFQDIVASQLPSYVQEDFPLLGEFLEQYYVSQEIEGGTYDLIQNIDQYVKVDELYNLADSTTLSTDISFVETTIGTGASTNLPIQLEAKVNEYLSLVMKLIFAFGISFQLPVVLSLLARIGVVDSDFLRTRRKYVVVIIFAAAAILTPPDPITQIGLAIPLLILYELSIFSVNLIEKKKLEQEEADA